MAQAANGFQTGFSLYPSAWRITPTQVRAKRFHCNGGLNGNAGAVFSLGAGAVGSISIDGVYTAPNFVTAPTVDQVLATSPDGSQAQSLVYLS